MFKERYGLGAIARSKIQNPSTGKPHERRGYAAAPFEKLLPVLCWFSPLDDVLGH